jgi:hypothetical protein
VLVVEEDTGTDLRSHSTCAEVNDRLHEELASIN